MRRKYDTAGFFRAAQLLRAHFPGCALTADLIAGFPGETEADFAETLAFIRRVGFAEMHVFPYSIRPGTRAAEMPGQLTHAVKNARAASAQAAAEEMQLAYLDAQVGQTLPVLFETAQPDGRWQGHSDNYCEVLAAGDSLHGIMKNVQITAREGKKLVGIIV
jgi:threonylcarbamoyladenosine tRNA methylthiotransferase MtaB